MNNAWSRFDDRKPVDSSYHKETRNNCRASCWIVRYYRSREFNKIPFLRIKIINSSIDYSVTSQSLSFSLLRFVQALLLYLHCSPLKTRSRGEEGQRVGTAIKLDEHGGPSTLAWCCHPAWNDGKREQRTRNRRNGGHRPPFLGFFQPRLPGRKWREREREVAAPASGREVTSAAARIFLGSSTRIRPRANAAERVAG